MLKENEDQDRKDSEPPVFDLGFGGLFRGIGDLVDLVSRVAEEGEDLASKQRELRFRLGDQEGRAVYGFNVRMGVGGAPRVERFGNVRSSDEGPIVADVREPLVDVFDEETEIVIVAEIPGVSEDEIHVALREDILCIETSGDHRYAKEILVSSPIADAQPELTYRNGILEIRLRKGQ